MLSNPLLLIALFLVSFAAAAPEVWWDDIKATFEGSVTRLRKCKRKNNIAPADGSQCSKKSKTCFFGNQDCDGDGTFDYPVERCVCSGKPGREWNCNPEPCRPTTDVTVVPVAACPTEAAFRGGDLTCGVEGQACAFSWDFSDCDAAAQSGGSGTQSADCTCNAEGSLDCTLAISQVSCFPPTLTACPTEERFREGDVTCYTPGHECNYEWELSTCDEATQTGIIGTESAACVCDGQALECEQSAQGVSCVPPVVLPPLTPHEEVCQDLNHNNDALCPAEAPSGGSCTAEQNGISCSWGEESCCGNCNASFRCSCFNGFWGCFYTDACFAAQCAQHQWHNLPGMTCAEATAAIHAVYPGMTVSCLEPGVPSPTDYNNHRYVVRLDANGFVTEVGFSRLETCASVEEYLTNKSCSASGQQCSYNYSSNDCDEAAQTGAVFTHNDMCTCVFGTFQCDLAISAVSCFPPTAQP